MRKLLTLVVATFVLLMSIPSMASAAVSEPQVISQAKKHLGVPYKYGGTTPSGFDCSGFIQYVFKSLGESVPRTTSQMYAAGTSVSKSNLEVGDLVFFKTYGTAPVSHAGIYIGGSQFIHASSSKGIMVSSINDPYYWGSRYVGAKRIVDFPEQTIVATAKPAPKPAVSPYATREEVAEIIAQELGLIGSSTTTQFTDVSVDNPYLESINAVADAGIFDGLNGKFNPDNHLTRAQMAKVLVNAFKLQGQKDANFYDIPESHWADSFVDTLYYHEITTGYGNGYYGPNDTLTKLQFRTFIDRSTK